jgi:hypothetical protein
MAEVDWGTVEVPLNDNMGYAWPLLVVPFGASEGRESVCVEGFRWKG